MEDTNIWTACGDGQFEIVKAFVAGGISVNAQDDYGYSPLHAACSYRNSEIATWLLSQGARVDLKDSDGETALMVCEDPVCADLLLTAGAFIYFAALSDSLRRDITTHSWGCHSPYVGEKKWN